jgi:hypothetical protein
LFRVTPSARAFLLREGTDLKYGARHLKRAIEGNIVCALSNLLATSQVGPGDMLCIDWDEHEQRLVFEKEGKGAVLPLMARRPRIAKTRAAASANGKAAESASRAAAQES